MFNFHQKGKSQFNTNSSYLSTSYSQNFPSGFQTSFENPYNSIYFQNSRRGSYDNSLGKTSFSGFFSPANPGNFYSFEQPIVFNSISNINLPQKKKKPRNDQSSFKQQYLDTIKEVYKPRQNRTHDYQEKSHRAYLQGGPLEKMKSIHQSPSSFKKKKSMELKDDEGTQESGNESIEEGKKQERVKKKTALKTGFREEESNRKYFLLPEIDRKQISRSMESGNLGFVNARQNKTNEPVQKNSSNASKNKEKREDNTKAKAPPERPQTQQTSTANHPTVVQKLNLQKSLSNRKIFGNYGIQNSKTPENENLNDDNSKSNYTETKSTNEFTKLTPTSGYATEKKMSRMMSDPFKITPLLLETSPNFGSSTKTLVSAREGNEHEKLVLEEKSKSHMDLGSITRREKSPKSNFHIEKPVSVSEKNKEKRPISSQNKQQNQGVKEEKKESPEGVKEEKKESPDLLAKEKTDEQNTNFSEQNNIFPSENVLEKPASIPSGENKSALLQTNPEVESIKINENQHEENNEIAHKTTSLKDTPLNLSAEPPLTHQVSIEPIQKTVSAKTEPFEPSTFPPKIQIPVSIESLPPSVSLNSFTPLNLLETLKSPHSESEVNEPSPLDSPPTLNNKRPMSFQLKSRFRSEGTGLDRDRSPSANRLTPSKSSMQKTSPFRRGTNTSCIDSSFSFMKKIFDDPENEIEEEGARAFLNMRRRIVLQHCDSITTHSTPSNWHRSDLRINFGQKNAMYRKKGTIETNERVMRKQNSKYVIMRLNNQFRKKINKFLKLLTNLQSSFRNSGDEANSFIFIESRFQTEEKPLINLKEILHKKTIEEHQTPLAKMKKAILQRSGTINSLFSFTTSPKTDPSKDSKERELNNSVFFIHVHPPTREEIIREEMMEETIKNSLKRGETDELESLKRKAEEMRGNIEEEQQKMIKIQVFNHQKLWKLSLGLAISNFKLILVNEKEFLFPKFQNLVPKSELRISTQSQKLIKVKKNSLSVYKILLEESLSSRVFEISTDFDFPRISDDDESMSPLKELEDESFEDVFEQDGGFIEDLKKLDNDSHLKFSHREHGELELLVVRKKSNNFIRFLPMLIIPIATKLENTMLNVDMRPPYCSELEDMESSLLSKKVMNSPVLQRKKNTKNLTLLIPLNAIESSKDSIWQSSPLMVKSDKTFQKKEDQSNHSKPDIKVFSDRVPNETRLFKLKSDKIMWKAVERGKSATNFSEEDEKEADQGRETDRSQPMNSGSKGGPFKTPSYYVTPSTPIIEMNSNNSNSQINPKEPKEEKAEKKLSFSLNQARSFSKKESKESKDTNSFKFINLVKRKQDKHSNTKLLKSTKNLLAIENDLKANEKNDKMDKSSLFFRNQLISINKMKNMDPVEQIFWAIRHNNILKIEEVFLMYPSIVIDSRDEDNNTFLNLAAQNGNVEIVNLFLMKGANVNLQNVRFFEINGSFWGKSEGNTALHLALSYNNDAIVDKLMVFGAQENIKNDEGKTPWDMLIKK